MSITTSQSANGYSANVRLLAHINGRTHRLSHVGPNEIILVEPIAINPGRISVDVVVDDHRQNYQAEIVTSFPAGTTRVPVIFIHHSMVPVEYKQ
jgi:hypothetical protein